jgi:hypothetical protein
MQTEDGKTIVLGEINFAGDMVDCYCHSTDGTYEIWVVALDNTGKILWQNCYGGTKWEAGFDIIAENNGYTFLGQTESTDGDVSFNNGDFDLWLVHIDSIGNLIWEENYGGSDADIGRQIYKTEENGYILLGATVSNDGDVNHSNCSQSQVYCQTNTWVVELDSNRNIFWNKTYGSATWSSYHTRNAAKRIGERDFIIAGLIEDTDNHSGDIDCEPYPINIGKSAWIYRLHSPDTGTFTNNLLVKELQLYPNPAQNQVIFELPIITKENILQIKDIFGKTIKELSLYKSQTQLVWDCSSISNGVYFYQTQINGEVYRGKIVIK